MLRGHPPSPQRCQSPLHARKASPRADPKAGWRTQTHLEPKALQLHCSQDFIQDGDSQVRDCSHETTLQWLVSVDLKDAYFHIGVGPAHHQYLRFHLLGQSYQFGALPFGLSSAPWVFTKTLAPLMAWLKLMAVPVYPYLDNILIMGESPREIEQLVQATLRVLTRAGFIMNLKKSNLSPDFHTKPSVHRGQILDRPRQGLPQQRTGSRES